MIPSSPYINLTSDAGFKLIFGNPDNAELTITMLRALIPERTIRRIFFLDKEIIPVIPDGKAHNLDIKCQEEDGTYFLVEMQKEPYAAFGNRLVAYSAWPLRRLLKKGKDYRNMNYLYSIAVLDYIMELDGEDGQEASQLVRKAFVKMEDSGTILSNRLNFLFLQLPAARQPGEATGFLEKLAYTIRNIGTMTGQPEWLDGEFFDKLFAASDRRNIDDKLLESYDNMVRDEIQIQAEKDYAVDKAMQAGHQSGLMEGMQMGLQKGAQDSLESVQRKMTELGIDPEIIKKVTGIEVK